ncbi:hypothetical protein [Teichococcus wenyumeiae]|nr:hypothetical protein [Pseudoroseomonas wenyumeiae]
MTPRLSPAEEAALADREDAFHAALQAEFEKGAKPPRPARSTPHDPER